MDPGLMDLKREVALHRQVDSDLENVRDLILEMGGCVEKALGEAVRILLNKNLDGIKAVEAQESRINEMHLLVDQACLRFLARQAPVARDLRFVMSVIKINADLERMGDQASNISYNAEDFVNRSPMQIDLSDIERMGKLVREMVRMALDAFVHRDIQLSKRVLEGDDAVDAMKDKIFKDLKGRMAQQPELIDPYLDLILIARNLERLADHATNLAEEVIFITTGDDIRHGQRHSGS